MPIITDITVQKRRENRRNVFLNGHFAFGCNINVIATFRLRTGLALTETEIETIEFGVVRQECLDKAIDYLSRRLHSRAEIARKLGRRDWSAAVIDTVLEDLTRLNYLDDPRFARAKAASCAKQKRLGRRRAQVDLIRAGIKPEIANAALTEIYSQTDTTASARALAVKAAPRLKRLDPMVARRRLSASLQRKGFDYSDIRKVIDEILPR